MATNKNGNNLGLFVALAAIFGVTHSLFSIGKGLQAHNTAMDQAIGTAEKLLREGLAEDEIVNAFCAEAAKQTGKSVDDKDIRNKVRGIVSEAKKRFEASGGSAPQSGLPATDLDRPIKDIILAIQNTLKKTEPLIHFDNLYAKAKEAEESKDTGDFQVFIQNQEYDTNIAWKAWADVEQKLSRITYFFDSSEPASVQRKREEMAKLNNLPGAFKNLLVTRGRVLRQVRNMYNGKNKREDTKQRDKEELKVLTKLFQNDIDRATAEIDVFNNVLEGMKTA